MNISLSSYNNWKKLDSKQSENSVLKLGQRFYEFFALDRFVFEKEFCDRLYQSDGIEAISMIESIVDWED